MRVGTSTFLVYSPHSNRDHPHACGDKDANKTLALFNTGSSPCVWGQDCVLRAVTVGAGIIPMRVGTS